MLATAEARHRAGLETWRPLIYVQYYRVFEIAKYGGGTTHILRAMC